MSIIEMIIVIIILISPILILLVPFAIAWRKGRKKLLNAKTKYEKALRISFKKLLNIRNITFEDKSDIEIYFNGENHNMQISGKIWLVDRRYYFYYLASIFRPLNDAISIEINLNRIPGIAMLAVSKDQNKLIQQALSYAEELEVADIDELSPYYLLLVDDLYAFRKIASSFVVDELFNLRRNLLYILIDYGTPNITIFLEVNEKNYHTLIPRTITLLRTLINSIEKLPAKKTKIEVLKRIRKTFSKMASQYKKR